MYKECYVHVFGCIGISIVIGYYILCADIDVHSASHLRLIYGADVQYTYIACRCDVYVKCRIPKLAVVTAVYLRDGFVSIASAENWQVKNKGLSNIYRYLRVRRIIADYIMT